MSCIEPCAYCNGSLCQETCATALCFIPQAEQKQLQAALKASAKQAEEQKQLQAALKASAKQAKATEGRMYFEFHQLSAQFHIKYSCTDMAASIAMKLWTDGQFSEEDLHTLFVEFKEIDRKLSKHGAVDTVCPKNCEVVSRDMVSIKGMQFEGPAMIKGNRSVDDTIKFVLTELRRCLKENPKVAFVACGGSASFGGCCSKENISFLDTHKQEPGENGAFLYSGKDLEVLKKRLSYIIVDKNAPFQLLVFVPKKHSSISTPSSSSSSEPFGPSSSSRWDGDGEF